MPISMQPADMRQATDHSGREQLYRKIDLRILPLLLSCYVLAYLDRVNIGFAKLRMAESIHLSEAAYGLGAGIFFLGYVLFEIPSNLLMDRTGARKTLSRIMILWGATSACMIFVNSATSFYILRFLLGVFEAGFAPGMILYLTYWYPKARMAKVLSIVMLAAPIGSTVGGPVSTFIMSAMDGFHGIEGWKWMFLLEALPCIPLGLIVFFYLSDRPDQAQWLTQDEKDILVRELAGSSDRKHDKFTQALRDPKIYILAFTYFTLISGIYTVSFWAPTLLRDAGVVGIVEVGLLSAIPFAVSGVAMLLAAWSSDRLQERRLHTCLFAAAAAISLAGAAVFAHQVAPAVVSLSLATASAFSAYTVFWAMPSEYLEGEAAAGGIAAINSIGLLGGFISPTLIGAVKDWTGSIQGGIFAMAVLISLGAAAILFFKKREI